MVWYPRRKATGLLAALVALYLSFAGCEPTVVIGTRTCFNPAQRASVLASDAGLDGSSDTSDDGGSDAGLDTVTYQGTSAPSLPVALPWSTGFEDGFCDYTGQEGFCFATGTGSFDLVDSPVHTGSFAAAFRVVADGGSSKGQARCVRQGVLPQTAYYGAWYYIPASVANPGVWNLFHFQGGSSGAATLHGLWDISLINDATGSLQLTLYNFLGPSPPLSGVPPIPIGRWFHIEIYLARASDRTGAVAVYQDGQQAASATGIVTDDSAWGQFYVGNYATDLAPPNSTLYVDDVTIAETQ